MESAWNMTYREYCLLFDVKRQIRGVVKSKQFYSAERVSGLEAHLKNIGAL
jgi:hypothetical protein